jgi:hypothetical protein
LQGLCPLTPEETSVVLKALGFDNYTQIYIAAGETYGGQKRIKVLEEEFPYMVRATLQSCFTFFWDNFKLTPINLKNIIHLDRDKSHVTFLNR